MTGWIPPRLLLLIRVRVAGAASHPRPSSSGRTPRCSRARLEVLGRPEGLLLAEHAQNTSTHMEEQRFYSESRGNGAARDACVRQLEERERVQSQKTNVKGELLCSQKDFRINLFIPGKESLILLRSTAATRLLLDQHPVDSVAQNQADADDGAADTVVNFLPLDDHMELDQNPEEHIVQQILAPSDGRGIRERQQVESGNQKQQDEAPPEEDVWALHDPYAVLAEEKPLKPGKCYRVPDGLDDGGKRKRRRAMALQDFRSWFRETFSPLVQKLKNGPTFTDLNYIYLSTLKNKVKTQRRAFRKTGMVMSEEELIRTFLQPEEAGLQQQEAELLGGDDTSDIEDDVPEFEGGPDFISPGGQMDDLTYEDLVKLRVEQLLVNSQGYTQETALSRRVKDWEDQIQPELVLQEKRPPFDIHDYGERIVGQLSSIGHRRSFASIVHGLDNFEACKFLLASLQLANDHTVEIHSAAGLEDSLDSMSLTLLSTQKATDRFKKLTTSTVMQRGLDQ